MVLPWEDVLKLLLAVLVGGLIGAEREYRDKAAGFRTIICITLGATLFTLFSLRLGGDRGDPARIAAAIVSGVGFLGAGAILRQGEHVVGLTTAATIWLAAALGMGIAADAYILVGVAAVLMLVILVAFPRFERLIDDLRETRLYEVVGAADNLALFDELEGMMADCGLQIKGCKRAKLGEEVTCSWYVAGSPEGHEQITGKLLAHPEVKQFRV